MNCHAIQEEKAVTYYVTYINNGNAASSCKHTRSCASMPPMRRRNNAARSKDMNCHAAHAIQEDQKAAALLNPFQPVERGAVDRGEGGHVHDCQPPERAAPYLNVRKGPWKAAADMPLPMPPPMMPPVLAAYWAYSIEPRCSFFW